MDDATRPPYLERLDGPLVLARAVQLELLLHRSLSVSVMARRWTLEAEVADTLERATRPLASTWLVSTEAGAPVGALFASAEREGAQCFIHRIIVDPAYRRRGIGDRLVDDWNGPLRLSGSPAWLTSMTRWHPGFGGRAGLSRSAETPDGS